MRVPRAAITVQKIRLPKTFQNEKIAANEEESCKIKQKTSSQSKVEIFDRFAFAARFVFRFSRFVRAISRARTAHTHNRSSSDRSIAQSIKVDRETFLPQAQSIYDQLRSARHSSLSIPSRSAPKCCCCCMGTPRNLLWLLG